tara:strand:+ start:6487 stop:7620 length:1134 start_codon:yes stop_codon:yes gene_type:complete
MQYSKLTNIKKYIFYFFTFFLIMVFFFLIDFLLSNTILKNKLCLDYTTNKKGYFYFLKKNCHTRERFKSSFPSNNLYTDNFGLRTGKNTKKDPTLKNILVFGDSMTYGVGLDYEKTYAGIIDEKMQNYNLYNFGVGSYAPSVHLYKLRQAIKQNIIPDKILLFLDLSDVNDEARRWVDDEESTDGIPRRPENKPNWAKEKKFFTKNFKLSKDISSIINFNLRNFRDRAKTSLIHNEENLKIKFSVQGQFTYTKLDNLDKSFWKDGEFLYGLNKIKKKISQISKLAKENNSKFYLIIYPWGETLFKGEKEFSWSNFGNDLCKINDCVLINAIPEFNKYKEINKNWLNELYFLNDEHLNKGGASFLANIVLKKIDKDGK